MTDYLAINKKVDSICNDFEQNWNPSIRPDFQVFLQQVESDQRPNLLRELLKVDIELRIKAGQSVTSAEYTSVGPHAASIVDEILRLRRSPKTEQSYSTTPSIQSSIEEIFQNFRLAQEQGQQPKIEEYIQDFSGIRRHNLTCQLIALNVAYRKSLGEKPTKEDYLNRFGINEDIVSAIVEQDSAPNQQLPIQIHNVPKQIHNYQIVERIGRGGMGDVFLARHLKFEGKRYAIKLLRRNIIADEAESNKSAGQAIIRFENEIRAIGKLHHPNIADAYDAGEVNGEPYLVMEYVDGVDAQKLVRLKGQISVADSCEIIRQACLGLQHAHEQGFVHRDIKPSNLMINNFGSVKVMDLGLAKLKESQVSHGLTATGTGLGTPDYMPPEQWHDATAVTIQSDIYSLGCTLYCLLTGKAPFQDSGSIGLAGKMNDHLKGMPARISGIRNDIPDAISNTINKALEKQPSARFQSPAEFAEELGPYCAGADLAALAKQAVDRPNVDALTETASLIKPNVETDPGPEPFQPQVSTEPFQSKVSTKTITGKSNRRWILAAVLAILVPAIAAPFLIPRSPPPQPVTPAAELKLSDIELTIYSHDLPNRKKIGVIGENLSMAYLSAAARIQAQCDGCQHVFVVACSPAGEIEVARYDLSNDQTDLIYPRSKASHYVFSDGRGQYAFVILAANKDNSLDPNAIKSSIESAKLWKTSQEPGIWRYDGNEVYPVEIEKPRGPTKIKSTNFEPFIAGLAEKFPDFEMCGIAIKVIAND